MVKRVVEPIDCCSGRCDPCSFPQLAEQPLTRLRSSLHCTFLDLLTISESGSFSRACGIVSKRPAAKADAFVFCSHGSGSRHRRARRSGVLGVSRCFEVVFLMVMLMCLARFGSSYMPRSSVRAPPRIFPTGCGPPGTARGTLCNANCVLVTTYFNLEKNFCKIQFLYKYVCDLKDNGSIRTMKIFF